MIKHFGLKYSLIAIQNSLNSLNGPQEFRLCLTAFKTGRECIHKQLAVTHKIFRFK